MRDMSKGLIGGRTGPLNSRYNRLACPLNAFRDGRNGTNGAARAGRGEKTLVSATPRQSLAASRAGSAAADPLLHNLGLDLAGVDA